MKNLIGLLTLLLLLISCSKNSEIQQCIEAIIDETITVKAGNVICLPGGEEVEILEITNQLCPCFVTCVSPGTIDYTLNIALPSGSSVAGQMHSLPPTDEIIITTINGDTLDYLLTSPEVTFVEECTQSNGSPDIESAQLILLR